MALEHLRYVAVEGPIGVGKTSLSRRLADHMGAGLMLENAQENPFLERFYQEPRAAALPTQLHFLFQRARQIERLRQGDMFSPALVADFLLEKDALFASVTLDDDELDLYRQVYRRLALDAPAPDLVLYLQAPVEVLQERIRKRGHAYELNIDPDYLSRLAEAYMQFFHHYEAAPLLTINATRLDFVNNEADFQALVKELSHMRAGRHYFNPHPEAL